MYKSPSKVRQASLFWDLEAMLSPVNSLYKLANLIDWNVFEHSFAPLYSKDTGRMAKPIRLMVGPLILKHLRDVSDESVVEQFSENAYFQYFCGMESFRTDTPCVPTELVEFRRRIGESGMELILKESIRINLLIDDQRKEKTMGERRQGWPRTQARCGADRIHRHDGAGEERDLPHGLETPEQGDTLLLRRGGEGKPQDPPELCQGDKGTEARATFQGQEEQQGQSQEG